MRHCELCGVLRATWRTFPATPSVQREWVVRLGLVEEESEALLHRLVELSRTKRIFWCSLHFPTDDEVPEYATSSGFRQQWPLPSDVSPIPKLVYSQRVSTRREYVPRRTSPRLRQRHHSTSCLPARVVRLR